MEEPEEGKPVTPHMGVYRSKIQYIVIIEKLNLIIVVRGDIHNKGLIGDTLSPTSSMRTLISFLEDAVKHNARVYQ